MRRVLPNLLWLAVLAATGYLIGTHAADGAISPKPAQLTCHSKKVYGTIRLDHDRFTITSVTLCDDGRVIVYGRR